MDIASAVQFLLAYEASLKLAPGQKPPPPSPSTFGQLSQAAAAIHSMMVQEVHQDTVGSSFSGLPPSVWLDWPLCCGLDLTSEELKAARSLSPSLLQDRGLLSLFLALHSCAIGGVDGGPYLAPKALILLAKLHRPEEPDPVTFPSVHLAVRAGHRLINADDTLDFRSNEYGDHMWKSLIKVPIHIFSNIRLWPNRAVPAVPHEAACLSLAKETAVILDALCAAQRGLENLEEDRCTRDKKLLNRLPFLMSLEQVSWLTTMMGGLYQTEVTHIAVRYHDHLCREAPALPAYNPMLLLKTFFRDIDLGVGHGMETFLEACRDLLWMPMSHRSPLDILRPADGYTAMRLGLEDMGRQRPEHDVSSCRFIMFAIHTLQSGLVRPELILRARPQLLEGLVDGLARGRIRGTAAMNALLMLSALIRSPGIGFHLRKFFSRSGCMRLVQETLALNDLRRELIRLLGPRAAQSDITSKPLTELPVVLQAVSLARNDIRALGGDINSLGPVTICSFIIRDLTLDILREPSHAQPFLHYLSELTNDIAAPKHPNARYGVLLVIDLGRACLAFSSTVAGALKDIRDAGPKGKGMKGSGGAGASGVNAAQKWRVQLVDMGKELYLLRRRVLRELLPLAEAREAALWEGVREEEVVAALTEGA